MRSNISIKIENSTGKYLAIDESSGNRYSIAELMRMADKGNPSAQCAMGDYYNSTSSHADFNEAFKWYKKAAAQNDAKALWNVGIFYAVGNVTERNFDKAIASLKESANLGFTEAMFYLGQIFMTRDMYDQAIYWLEKADKSGHPQANEILQATKLLSKAYNNSPDVKSMFEEGSKEFWNKE